MQYDKGDLRRYVLSRFLQSSLSFSFFVSFVPQFISLPSFFVFLCSIRETLALEMIRMYVHCSTQSIQVHTAHESSVSKYIELPYDVQVRIHNRKATKVKIMK